MNFQHDPPIFVNEKLCSCEIFSPSQIQNPDQSFELFGSAWFGTISEDIPTANGVQTITFGFHTATLAIETCENSRMRNQGRYEGNPVEYHSKNHRDETARSAQGGSIGGGVSASWRLFAFQAKGERSTGKATSDVTTSSQDGSHIEYEVRTSSPTKWEIRALNPARPTLHLDGRELKEAPLCVIEASEGRASVTAHMSVSSADIWLEAATDSTNPSLEDQANQNAVLSVLVAKAAEHNSIEAQAARLDKNRDVFGGEDEAIIAQSTLHLRELEEEE